MIAWVVSACWVNQLAADTEFRLEGFLKCYLNIMSYTFVMYISILFIGDFLFISMISFIHRISVFPKRLTSITLNSPTIHAHDTPSVLNDLSVVAFVAGMTKISYNRPIVYNRSIYKYFIPENSKYSNACSRQICYQLWNIALVRINQWVRRCAVL